MATLGLPSLHIIGNTDTAMPPEASQQLAAAFDATSRQVGHAGCMAGWLAGWLAG